MVRMVGRPQHNNLTTMHSHKPMLRGMVMARQQQQTAQGMPTIKHRVLQPHTRGNKDINLTHVNHLVDHLHYSCVV